VNKYVIAKYVRLSLEDAKYDSLSIANQQIMLDKHIESLDIADAQILEFIDNGHSGTNFERPAVQELLELVRCSKIDCIIVKDFSRFGRNSIEMGYFIEKVFPIYNVRFISISDNYDSDNYEGDTGGIEVAFKYLINEIYSQDLSVKTKTAKLAKMKRGEFVSKICPYGYRKNAEKRLEIDDEAAEVVRIIFGLAAQSWNGTQIMQELYKKRIPTPGEYKKSNGFTMHDVSRSHGIWQRSTVLRILSDERYTGMYVAGRFGSRRVGESRSFPKDESEWIKIPDHHPAIISKELFAEANSKIYRFKSTKRKNSEHLLKSKVFCGCCDHAMYRRPQAIFECNHSKIDSAYLCHGLEIKECELESLLFEIISKQAEIILGVGNINNAAELTSKLNEQSDTELQIRQFMDEKRRLYEQHVLGEIDDKTYREQKSVCDSKLDEIKGLHSGLVVQTAEMQADKEKTADLKSVAKSVVGAKSLTREIVDTLIERVEIFPENQIEIAWKFADFSTLSCLG
jgi:DNA invertase Pin-like site-specific DNA recombinase/CYTH domain-containing protein